MAGFLKTALNVCAIYALCLFYSVWTILPIAWNYFWNHESRFWIPKDHSVQPKCLRDPKYGEHKFAQINGIKLHYVTKGSPDRPLMLFVHGCPEFWYSWRHQLIEFSQDYFTVAVDMRGYGDSEKPSGIAAYKTANMRADIKALIEHLGYKKCILVCHDWGAVIGWTFVQHHMDMIDRYVMLASPDSSVWRSIIFSTVDQFRKSWYMFMFQIPLLPELWIRIYDFALFAAIFEHKNAEDLEAYKHMFAKPGALTGPVNYYRANFIAKLTAEPLEPKNYGPGLYAIGERDMFASQAAGPMSQKMFKNLRFESVKNANHFLQQDNPEETNRLIRKFLAETR